MPEALSDTIQVARARAQAVLDSGRLSPRDRARILGYRLTLPAAQTARITVDCRTGVRQIERGPRAEHVNPFDRPSKAGPPPPPPRPQPVAPRVEPTSARRSAGSVADRAVVALSAAFKVSVADIFGPRRTQAISRARFALYRLLSEAHYSLTAIGRAVGRDHTSVLSGLRRAETYHATDPDWCARYEAVAAQVPR